MPAPTGLAGAAVRPATAGWDAARGENDDDDEQDGLGERLEHFADRVADDLGGVERDLVLQSGRETPGQPDQLRFHVARDVERVRGRQLDDAEPDGLLRLETQLGRVGFRAQLGMADVLETHQGAVGPGFQNDVVEVGRLGQHRLTGPGPHRPVPSVTRQVR